MGVNVPVFPLFFPLYGIRAEKARVGEGYALGGRGGGKNPPNSEGEFCA